jgi:hypothetical protein
MYQIPVKAILALERRRCAALDPGGLLVSEAFATDRLETVVARRNSIAGADRDAAAHPDVRQGYEVAKLQVTKGGSTTYHGELVRS